MFNKKQRKQPFIFRILLAMGSFTLWLLSFSFVRNWMMNKAINKGKEKIVDAKARTVRKG